MQKYGLCQTVIIKYYLNFEKHCHFLHPLLYFNIIQLQSLSPSSHIPCFSRLSFFLSSLHQRFSVRDASNPHL